MHRRTQIFLSKQDILMGNNIKCPVQKLEISVKYKLMFKNISTTNISNVRPYVQT